MSTIKADTLSNLLGTLSVPVATAVQGSAKAWVNFNGTGTVAIRASFNVSSITDNGTGDYTINFTNALQDANYSIVGGAVTPGTASGFFFPYLTWGSTTSARVAMTSTGFALTDFTYISAAVFR